MAGLLDQGILGRSILWSSLIYLPVSSFGQPPRAVTITQVERSFGASGITTIEKVRRIAYRADGSWASAPAGNITTNTMQPRVIELVNAGRMLYVVDPLRIKSTFALPRRTGPFDGLMKEGKCLPAPGEALRMYSSALPAGLSGESFAKEVRSENSVEKVEIWRSFDLRCSVSRAVTRTLDASGERILHSLETVSVTFGEPDAELFKEPADYEELPPSKLHLRVLKTKGQERGVPTSFLKHLEELDRKYWANRPVRNN